MFEWETRRTSAIELLQSSVQHLSVFNWKNLNPSIGTLCVFPLISLVFCLAETMTFGLPGECGAHVFLKAHQFCATGITMVLKIRPSPLDPFDFSLLPSLFGKVLEITPASGTHLKHQKIPGDQTGSTVSSQYALESHNSHALLNEHGCEA
uniref:Uncharacterized protein n=1 Tax=Opuntia streptacantha TaxID=393608 RepID=A0A7C9EJH8_OPUST